MDTDFIRWYWSVYRVQFTISLMLVIGFLLLFSMMGCSYQLDDKTTVYGNCGELYKYSVRTVNLNQFVMNDTFTPVPVCDCPKISCPKITCPPIKECVERVCVENITPKVECFCKECPQDGAINKVMADKLLNIRPGANGNPAISHGYFMCKEDVLALTGLKGSKFNEGPAVGGYKDYYDSQGVRHIDNQTFCFRDIAGYFIVNRSIWGWNDSQCLSSSLKITKMD